MPLRLGHAMHHVGGVDADPRGRWREGKGLRQRPGLGAGHCLPPGDSKAAKCHRRGEWPAARIGGVGSPGDGSVASADPAEGWLALGAATAVRVESGKGGGEDGGGVANHAGLAGLRFVEVSVARQDLRRDQAADP